MKKARPIRMCIACRRRFPQDSLIRLKQEGNAIVVHDGVGRSFYICSECARNEKKRRGLLKRFRQKDERLIELLKELIDNG
jgi:predicted RNA-binding protein YlxR (DUF448 family)